MWLSVFLMSHGLPYLHVTVPQKTTPPAGRGAQNRPRFCAGAAPRSRESCRFFSPYGNR
jgi:hypothetical protein